MPAPAGENRSLEIHKLSVVIPVFNEAENITALYEQLTRALDAFGIPYELVMIDDGSRDATVAKLVDLRARDNRIKIIKLRRNFGQHPATFAGFDYATGEVIVTIDADLQNDPADIPKLVNKMREGYDVVSGWRTVRNDSWLRRKLPSLLVNRFISSRSGLQMRDYGCGLKAYTNRAAKEIAKYGQSDGWYPAMFGWLGFSVEEVEVSHSARADDHGSHYNIFAQMNQFMSLFTGLATRPFQFIEILGAGLAMLGIAIFIWAILDLIFWRSSNLVWEILLGALNLLGGIIIGVLGLLGEYLVRIYYETKRNPKYLIERILE